MELHESRKITSIDCWKAIIWNNIESLGQFFQTIWGKSAISAAHSKFFLV